MTMIRDWDGVKVEAFGESIYTIRKYLDGYYLEWVDKDGVQQNSKELYKEYKEYRMQELIDLGHWKVLEEKPLVLEEHPLESYPNKGYELKGSPAKQSALETRKDDKNMMHLVDTGFPNSLLALGEVMSWAARNKGYLPNDWKDIPSPFDAFLGAASRHRNKRLAGEDRDDESGLYHLAHEAFNVLAQLELKMLGKLDD